MPRPKKPLEPVSQNQLHIVLAMQRAAKEMNDCLRKRIKAGADIEAGQLSWDTAARLVIDSDPEKTAAEWKKELARVRAA